MTQITYCDQESIEEIFSDTLIEVVELFTDYIGYFTLNTTIDSRTSRIKLIHKFLQHLETNRSTVNLQTCRLCIQDSPLSRTTYDTYRYKSVQK